MLFVVEVPDFSPAVAATFARLNRIVSVIREPAAGTWIFPTGSSNVRGRSDPQEQSEEQGAKKNEQQKH